MLFQSKEAPYLQDSVSFSKIDSISIKIKGFEMYLLGWRLFPSFSFTDNKEAIRVMLSH